MNRVEIFGRLGQLWLGCGAFYAVLHVTFIVFVGGRIGLMLAFLLIFHIARNAARFYRLGVTWLDLRSATFPSSLLYFLPAPTTRGRPVLWPGIWGTLWLSFGALVGWAAGGPSLTDPLIQYSHVLIVTGLAGMVLGWTYGAVAGRFEVYTMQSRIGPTGKFRASFHAAVFLMMFFIQMNFVHPDLRVFAGYFGTAWNARTEGGSHQLVRGKTPVDGILSVHFGNTTGKITFFEFISAAIAQPIAGVWLRYQWWGDETPDLWLVFSGSLKRSRSLSQTSAVHLTVDAQEAGSDQEAWQETFVPLDQTSFFLLTGIAVEKRSAGLSGVLRIKEVRLVRTKDNVPVPPVTTAQKRLLKDSEGVRQDDQARMSQKLPTVPSDHKETSTWRSVRGWLVPFLLIVWGLGYWMGTASVQSKWRNRRAFQNADLAALLLNGLFVMGLLGVMAGETVHKANVVGVIILLCMAYSGGFSVAYLRQRIRETQR